LDPFAGNHSKFPGRCAAFAFALTGVLALAPGCSSDSSASPTDDGGSGSEAMCPSGGGPVSGKAPDHCNGTFQDVGMCLPSVPDDGGASDAGVPPLPGPVTGKEY